ncbi:MAG: NRDE family protein [Proteobacteria bacterium]|nr:NRDE family protein [Pseudomonadota bacterium]
MCVIFFAHQIHPDYPLILLANRDEFFQRPTEPAHYWRDHPELLAGKDLQAGGTWLGVTKNGRYSAITNIRDPKNNDANAPSRGNLVKEYLFSDKPPEAYLSQIGKDYNGFNQLVGEGDQLYHYNSQDKTTMLVKSGIYGLSNAQLNTPWPKISKGIKQVDIWSSFSKKELRYDLMLKFMHDTSTPDDNQLPDTGVGIELERLLSPVFISGKEYGTRCTTLLLIDSLGEVVFIERNYVADGVTTSENQINSLIDQ